MEAVYILPIRVDIFSAGAIFSSTNDLYNSDFDLLLNAVHEVDNAVNTLLLVAHNPGIHTLAARLAADDGSPLSERLLMGYAPATLTVLECEIESWENLQIYSNKVAAVHETTEYNAEARPTRWM